MNSITYEKLLQSHFLSYKKDNDYYYGYIDSESNFSEFTNDLLKFGMKFVTRSSQGQSKKGNEGPPICFSSKKGAVPIEYFGQPFTIIKNTLFDCKFGENYHKSYKGQPTNDFYPTHGDHHYRRKERLRNRSSKKQGCPATMNVKQVVVYPSEKYNVKPRSSIYKTETAQKRTYQLVVSDLKENNVIQIMRFYIRIVSFEVHNHLIEGKIEFIQEIENKNKEMYSAEKRNVSKKRIFDLLDQLKTLAYLCNNDNLIEETRMQLEQSVQQIETDLNQEIKLHGLQPFCDKRDGVVADGCATAVGLKATHSNVTILNYNEIDESQKQTVVSTAPEIHSSPKRKCCSRHSKPNKKLKAKIHFT